MVTVPVSFQFNIPVKDAIEKKTKVTHGIVSERREGGEMEKCKEEKDWYKAASGLRAEQKIFDKLQEQFSDQPCLLVNGFHEQDMIKVIREEIKGIKGKGKLSDKVRILLHSCEVAAPKIVKHVSVSKQSNVCPLLHCLLMIMTVVDTSKLEVLSLKGDHTTDNRDGYYTV